MTETRTCPFPDCDYSREYDPDDEYDVLYSESIAELHYENQHAGRVKIQITLEKEELLGARDPVDAADAALDKMSEDGEVPGWDVAYARAEEIEESDDHSQLDRTVPRED